MCDLISGHNFLFEAAMWVKSTHLIVVCENQKKRKYGNTRSFYINLYLKNRLHIEFTGILFEVRSRMKFL